MIDGAADQVAAVRDARITTGRRELALFDRYQRIVASSSRICIIRGPDVVEELDLDHRLEARAIANPMARPTMFASASGVLNTRVPIRTHFCSPERHLEDAALALDTCRQDTRLGFETSATSSPKTRIFGSRRISSFMVTHSWRSTIVVGLRPLRRRPRRSHRRLAPVSIRTSPSRDPRRASRRRRVIAVRPRQAAAAASASIRRQLSIFARPPLPGIWRRSPRPSRGRHRPAATARKGRDRIASRVRRALRFGGAVHHARRPRASASTDGSPCACTNAGPFRSRTQCCTAFRIIAS